MRTAYRRLYWLLGIAALATVLQVFVGTPEALLCLFPAYSALFDPIGTQTA